METNICLLTKETLTYHVENYNLIGYERLLVEEISSAIGQKDSTSIEWFAQFGNTLRKILFNVHAYRMGLRFGFDNIEFDEYDWLSRPTFQDIEELSFGLPDKSRYGNYSTITLGHGPNQIWTYGLSCSYGTAGSSSGICVYDQTFANREEALKDATTRLKKMMVAKVGDKDTTNHNQKIIAATLKDIDRLQTSSVQLTLF
ncbi:hypothetical protein EA772_01900 [Pedobacter sp. G11]|uniref:hypothetical protein n=1 Tax=Pedobacter sp. G11 TaxID=2482728 RepID=UPI000F5DF396|nr:hypothetical protein [Pedobacter sp. G11]AZI24158.1 hypothetical protein EA772_01900 [Pedobacter sp. G11]